MGLKTNLRKRKATAPDDEIEKVKKVKQMAADILPPKRRAADDPPTTKVEKSKSLKPSTFKGARPTSVMTDYATKGMNSTPNASDSPLIKPKSSSDVKSTKKKLAEAQSSVELDVKKSKIKKPDLAETMLVASDDTGDAFNANDSEEDEMDDQTEALLKGFESSDDGEQDPDGGHEVGDEVPRIAEEVRKSARKADKGSPSSGKPGVVYIGRIPHGFYEQEMRQYFSQFGDITNLRLSRNRKTGKSKHFAFVEFESAEVAEIVSKTMDNYLLFGHILKCKLVEPEQVHKDLWIGANKRYKTIPWNKIQGHRLSQAMVTTEWERRVMKEEKRRAEKRAAMKLMDYDFKSPKLKSAKDIIREKEKALIVSAEDEVLVEEAAKPVTGPENPDVEVVIAEEKANNKEMKDNIDNPEVTDDVTKNIGAFPTGSAELRKKKTSRDAKRSNQFVNAAELKEPGDSKGADTSSVGKVNKFKKSKKNRVVVATDL